ncbi:ExbD/TolR family protein [Aquirufa antheringensis]|jgi:biopolymer transport protein ExbD|uniref:Biopolymer transporter ExbD n=1 Tax=Aquirufa antheringensis TaxID=2516559 RepID=A0A4Q9BAB8_9BACT|nr:biopolymer transporter ExbD [Aquirufa antheringensis]MCE4215869.1 biopolymer transporter ExbD [Pseudarcicella sp. GAP-15]MCL9968099.1 biopolymer transporter ExbD [Aquirufa antheringensis]MCZ2477433.1 biopolymer transporter ExbD [Aquirufa antheringensis]MCZ2485326.1 biopolymer transporter ExbD [Aquirufa antheringensis]MCZ2488277.1 biopolymer transporter ExbD [Aquirufa antheringensis]
MAEIDSSGGGKKGGKKRSKKMSTKIDMTPMVDLGFLLITFFMLTTTLAKPVTMQLNMPDKTDTKETSPVKLSESLTVCPDENKVYYYQGIPTEAGTVMQVTNYSETGIRKVIADMKAKVGNNFTIVIKPTKKAKYRNMIDMLDECAITNNKRYALLEIDPDTEALIKRSGK